MQRIADLVEEVRTFGQKTRALGAHIRSNPPQYDPSDPVVEYDLLHQVDVDPLDKATIAGIDGGLIQKELHGLDLVLTRAVAARFSYENGALAGHAYIPEKNPRPNIEVIRTPLQKHDFHISASLLRMIDEAEQVQKMLQEDLDLVLLDGSIVPHAADKPANDSRARSFYRDMINHYEQIYATVMDAHLPLAGVIEDSRGTQLCQFLAEQYPDKEEILAEARDTTLLSHVMDVGERTCVMQYTASVEQHPTLRDLPHGEHIYSFYLKTVKHDRPIRVDFLSESPVEDADRLAALIHPISALNSQYGIPAVLIEADQRAALSSHDLNLLEGKLRAQLDIPAASDLRRKKRPF